MIRVKRIFVIVFISLCAATTLHLLFIFCERKQLELETVDHLQYTNSSPRIGLITYVPDTFDKLSSIQFSTMLYSSWKFSISHIDLAAHVQIPNHQQLHMLNVVDMLILCSASSCKQLPSDCVKFEFPYKQIMKPQCLYFPMLKNQENDWFKSFLFAFDNEVTKMSTNFGFFLIVDTSCLLTPAVLVWQPSSDFAKSEIGDCSNLNKSLVSTNFTNAQADCVSSSFYLKSTLAQRLSYLAINRTLDMFKNEVVGLLQKGANRSPSKSLGLLDANGCDIKRKVMKVVQLRSGSCTSDFIQTLISLRNSKTLDPRLYQFFADREVINMSLRDYTNFVIWQGAGKYVPRIRAWVMSSLSEKYVEDIF